MGVIVTKGSGGSTGSGVFSQAEKLALEMEMEFKTASTSYYKELDYSSGGLLTNIDIWTSSAKTLQLFDKLLQYDSAEKLSKTLLTRVSDDSKILKFFGYDGSDNLTTITVSAG